ncbi:Glu-tRNA(Gln) amidotransferase subunit GatD [Candidatus Micrarchaeota archaeon]|nr:Glu-tRNA(Gln) amidotransferase subunit GatD [Candidatus Micrarchaeota archaeon]
MYAPEIEKLLKQKKISLGDQVKVVSSSGEFIGLLMPRPEYGDQGVLIIKLNTGYNVGIAPLSLNDPTSIEIVSKSSLTKPTNIKTAKPTNSPEKHIGANGSAGEVVVLGCGGTIASKVDYKSGAVYPAISPEELRASFPQIEKISTIHTKQLFSIFSEDMSVWHWQQMAEACIAEIKEGVTGIVLMHGTDTLGYSSAALSFMLQNLPVPIVFVGAQRSSDRPSSDNEQNLLNAIFAAKADFAEVSVCMHGESNDSFAFLHRGTRIRKMHTSRRDAFRSINASPLAKIDYASNKFEKLQETKPRSTDVGKIEINTKMSDNVAMAYFHPGMQPGFFKHLSAYDGAVVIATGMGHVATNPFGEKHSKSLLEPIKELISSNIPVVFAPQTLSGRLNLNVYSAGRLLKEAGVIGDGCDYLPETAFAKLSWVLGQTKDMKKIKELMEKNLVGEISSRSTLDFDEPQFIERCCE